VRPIALAVTMLVLTAGCETSTDPFLFGIGGSGGGPITQTQATGDWSFTVTKANGSTCSAGALADGSVLTAHLDVGTDGTVNSSTSSWRSPSGIVFPIAGVVGLSDGHTDLHLSGGSGSQTGMELIGTTSSAGTFSGTLTDPDPGLFPMFGTGVCPYTTAGTKA
jgi:hypothetical protein